MGSIPRRHEHHPFSCGCSWRPSALRCGGQHTLTRRPLWHRRDQDCAQRASLTSSAPSVTPMRDIQGRPAGSLRAIEVSGSAALASWNRFTSGQVVASGQVTHRPGLRGLLRPCAGPSCRAVSGSHRPYPGDPSTRQCSCAGSRWPCAGQAAGATDAFWGLAGFHQPVGHPNPGATGSVNRSSCPDSVRNMSLHQDLQPAPGPPHRRQPAPGATQPPGRASRHHPARRRLRHPRPPIPGRWKLDTNVHNFATKIVRGMLGSGTRPVTRPGQRSSYAAF
jgi:hypothetical protein